MWGGGCERTKERRGQGKTIGVVELSPSGKKTMGSFPRPPEPI